MRNNLSKNNQQGFALLFSVLISSLLLTVGLSIFSIALKELAISTAARQSIHAFFAADSGRECLIYWDVKEGEIPTVIDARQGGIVTCGSKEYSFTIDEGDKYNPDVGPKTTKIPEDDDFALVSGNSEANFTVEMRKSRLTADGDIITTVISRGYDSASSGDRVERAIEQTY
jgi:hypothetical protein